MYIYIYTYKYRYKIHVQDTCTYTCTYTLHIHLHMHLHIHIETYVCGYMYIYIYIYTHSYIGCQTNHRWKIVVSQVKQFWSLVFGVKHGCFESLRLFRCSIFMGHRSLTSRVLNEFFHDFTGITTVKARNTSYKY